MDTDLIELSRPPSTIIAKNKDETSNKTGLHNISTSHGILRNRNNENNINTTPEGEGYTIHAKIEVYHKHNHIDYPHEAVDNADIEEIMNDTLAYIPIDNEYGHPIATNIKYQNTTRRMINSEDKYSMFHCNITNNNVNSRDEACDFLDKIAEFLHHTNNIMKTQTTTPCLVTTRGVNSQR